MVWPCLNAREFHRVYSTYLEYNHRYRHKLQGEGRGDCKGVFTPSNFETLHFTLPLNKKKYKIYPYFTPLIILSLYVPG